MDRWSHYRFRSVWELAADPDTVYGVLERPDRYPDWWPQVREVARTDDSSGTLRFRSVLPYDLVVTARATVQDPGRRVLEVAMAGDLEGTVRWTVLPAAPELPPGGTHLVFEQDVVVCKPLMRLFALPCRPLFIANHALMMRGGRTGLLARLAADAGNVV
ncbi:SRPBCC family protein [Streptomyces sp. NBC_01476]|uniref:SRPBCC family protein n=1 Tax=Streptomyces sp. NBC_01476 TaxID=2903881 RepID=UPI002E32F57A|nr:SRPBCC family protein [Streptomyces sp. NBC_01476]